MPALVVEAPWPRRTLAAHDTPDELASWAVQAVRERDADLPAPTAGVVGQIVKVLVDNAQRHGRAPITVELVIGAAVGIEVTDYGAGVPKKRTDGTGSLAVIVGRLGAFWDVIHQTDGSKTATVMVSIAEEQPPQTRRATARR